MFTGLSISDMLSIYYELILLYKKCLLKMQVIQIILSNQFILFIIARIFTSLPILHGCDMTNDFTGLILIHFIFIFQHIRSHSSGMQTIIRGNKQRCDPPRRKKVHF